MKPNNSLDAIGQALDAGLLDQALVLVREVEDLDEQAAKAWRMVGEHALQRGRIADAAECHRRLVEACPSDATAWRNLGALRLEMGELTLAIAALQRSATLAPENAVVYFYLGLALQDAGDYGQAVETYRQCVMRKPEHAQAWNNLGSCLEKLGEFQEAEQSYRRGLRIDPQSIAALNNLALLLRGLGRRQEARQHLHWALQLAPGTSTLWSNLGLIDMDEGLMTEAERCFGQALLRHPGHAESQYHLGQVQLMSGRIDAARASFQQAMDAAPDWALPRVQLGVVDAQMGEFDQASQLYRDALAVDPQCAEAYSCLSQLPRHRFSPPERAALEEIAANQGLHSPARSTACFALARLLDREDRTDEAFQWLERGHALFRPEYDPAAHDAYVDALIEVFRPPLWSERCAAGSASEQPIFIVGVPRSGTTLVEQILAAHQKVEPRGEVALFNELTHALAEAAQVPYPRVVSTATNEALQGVGQRFQAAVATDKTRFTDKTPANFLHLGLIALLFPKARVIHCRRHPLDVLLSCYFCALPNLSYSHRLDHLGHYYLAYRRLMEHWRSVLPLSIHEVNYEFLLANQRQATEQLLRAAGLPWREECLWFQEHQRRIDSSSFWQARQPLYQTSAGRWRRYARQLEPLSRLLEPHLA